jgi:hypothetical protein
MWFVVRDSLRSAPRIQKMIIEKEDKEDKNKDKEFYYISNTYILLSLLSLLSALFYQPIRTNFH